MSDLFQPRSVDSMFATLIAKQEAESVSRESFRSEMRERFDRGSQRMYAQDVVLAAIKTQAEKTDGRVNRIEEAELTRRLELLELAEIAHRTEAARRKGILWVVAGIAGFLQVVGMAGFSWWLSRK